MPPALIPAGFLYALAGAAESHDAPRLYMAQQGYRSPKMSPASAASPADQVLCCPLGSEAEPDIAFPPPPLPGPSWDFHNC